MTWREEWHLTISVASDASGSGWGGTLLGDRGCVVKEVRDSWTEPTLSQPIHVKESVALSRTLLALADEVRNHRVDVHVDSRILLDCWQRQYTRSPDMLSALKELFWVTVRLNLSLSLKYIPTTQNPADALSRHMSDRYPRKYWWPFLCADSVHTMCIARQGETGVLLRPSKAGVVKYGPIPWDLWAFRLVYG
jgi:hypothetical protein